MSSAKVNLVWSKSLDNRFPVIFAYVDLDNTLLNFGKGIRKITKTVFGNRMSLSKLIEQFQKRNQTTRNQAKYDVWQFLVIEHKLFENLKPFKGARTFVKKLHILCNDNNIQLRILTGCPTGFHEESTIQKMKCVAYWFGKLILPENVFCVGTPSDDFFQVQKTTYATECAILFDDRDGDRWVKANGKAAIKFGTTVTDYPDKLTYELALMEFNKVIM